MDKKRGCRTLQLVLFAVAFLPHTVSAQAEATSDAAADGKFHVKGVLISDRGRSALVNGRLVRENERVADAEVVEISEHDVRLRRDGYDLTILVGGSANWSHASPIQQHAAVHSRPKPAQNHNGSVENHHKVAGGETLSGIAERHVPAGGTLAGTMLAIFEANPQAFYGDMHSLRAGVTLVLPTAVHANPDTRIAVRSGDEKPALGVYGPIREGESLSAIAAKLADARYTADQLMTALFAKNPQAFGDNINVLYAGAELRLPDSIEIARRTPSAAADEIARHMTDWNERRRAPPLQAALTSARRSSLP